MRRKAYFILDGEVDKVGIHQNPVRWPQSGVVFEKKGRRNIGPDGKHRYVRISYNHVTCVLIIKTKA